MVCVFQSVLKEQPAAMVELAFGALVEDLVTTQLQPVSLVIVEPVMVSIERLRRERRSLILERRNENISRSQTFGTCVR